LYKSRNAKRFALVVFLFTGPLTPSMQQSTNPEFPLCLQKFDAPAYPQLARQARIEGTVAVTLRTDVDGFVLSTDIRDGHPFLKGAVETAITKLQVCMKPHVDTWQTRFEFKLVGEPTDGWAPTFVDLQPPGTWVITTRPAPCCGTSRYPY
jgi:Gram-negative bacterial TonB protein C-terminal